MKFYITYIYDEFLRTRHYFYLLYSTFDAACNALEKEVKKYTDFIPPCRDTLKQQIDKDNYVCFYKYEDSFFLIRALPVVE